MAKNNFIEVTANSSRKKVEEISDLINEEEMKDNVDRHRLLKLYEERMLRGSMMNMFNGVYGKYNSPW